MNKRILYILLCVSYTLHISSRLEEEPIDQTTEQQEAAQQLAHDRDQIQKEHEQAAQKNKELIQEMKNAQKAGRSGQEEAGKIKAHVKETTGNDIILDPTISNPQTNQPFLDPVNNSLDSGNMIDGHFKNKKNGLENRHDDETRKLADQIQAQSLQEKRQNILKEKKDALDEIQQNLNDIEHTQSETERTNKASDILNQYNQARAELAEPVTKTSLSELEDGTLDKKIINTITKAYDQKYQKLNDSYSKSVLEIADKQQKAADDLAEKFRQNNPKETQNSNKTTTKKSSSKIETNIKKIEKKLTNSQKNIFERFFDKLADLFGSGTISDARNALLNKSQNIDYIQLSLEKLDTNQRHDVIHEALAHIQDPEVKKSLQEALNDMLPENEQITINSSNQ